MDKVRLKKLLGSRTARIFLLCLAALLLLLAVWCVFFPSKESAYTPTDRESRLCSLLSDVEGVKDATAMITEEDGVPVCAIVVFSGADSILTRMRVIDITAAALNLPKSKVQVYPAEN